LAKFDNTITMDDEDWGEDDIKEFVRMVKKSEKTWKLPSEELKVINLGTEKDKKRIEDWYPYYSQGKRRSNLVVT
jgi:hypothetical protein